MVMAANNKLLRSPSILALVVITALCTFSAAVAAAQSTSPALPNFAGMPSGDKGPSATQPAAATEALPPSSAATTASQKFPLPAGAAEVASALPVPTPDELPSAASLGFGDHGDECCGGGGYGWFGGPGGFGGGPGGFGGGPGGFGPGTYGYNGPLYFGAAPPARNVAASVLLPLVVACVSAAMCV